MKIKSVISVITFLLCYFIVCASEYYQATSNLNIRKGIGIKTEVTGSIAQGDKVLVDTIISGWGRIKVDGKFKGFASMKYLTKDFKDSAKNKKENSPWQGILIILILIIIAVFFTGSKSESSASSKSRTEIQKERYEKYKMQKEQDKQNKMQKKLKE